MHSISRRGQVAPFLAMDVLARANALEKTGRRILHLETGQPATAAPRSGLLAAHAALERDALGYTEALGRTNLRERIARHYQETYGLAIAPERVVLTTGSSAGFILTFLALFDPGQRLAMAVPCYPAYRNTAQALGIVPGFIRTGPEDGFRLGPGAVARAGVFDGLLITSPANPTGTVLSAETLGALANLCHDRNAWLISDEIYHGLTFGPRAHSALEFSPSAIVINSFSKFYSMTGWRIGWMVVPEALVRVVERLAQNLYISPPAISQAAALAAMDAGPELEALRSVYQVNRAALLTALQRIGINSIAPADGAFYLYADVSSYGLDSAEFAARLLTDTGVAITPGNDFDPEEGPRWVRISYAGSQSDIAEAASLIEGWIAQIGSQR